MSIILSIILFAVFTILSCIHFYWVFGGKKGKYSIPVNEKNLPIIKPTILSTSIVGILLMIIGFINIIKTKIINITLPEIMENYSLLLVAALFFLRAIGEFKYIGFFKKIKNTDFGIIDTKLFCPLCLFISITEIIIELMNK